MHLSLKHTFIMTFLWEIKRHHFSGDVIHNVNHLFSDFCTFFFLLVIPILYWNFLLHACLCNMSTTNWNSFSSIVIGYVYWKSWVALCVNKFCFETSILWFGLSFHIMISNRLTLESSFSLDGICFFCRSIHVIHFTATNSHQILQTSPNFGLKIGPDGIIQVTFALWNHISPLLSLSLFCICSWNLIYHCFMVIFIICLQELTNKSDLVVLFIYLFLLG